MKQFTRLVSAWKVGLNNSFTGFQLLRLLMNSCGWMVTMLTVAISNGYCVNQSVTPFLKQLRLSSHSYWQAGFYHNWCPKTNRKLLRLLHHFGNPPTGILGLKIADQIDWTHSVRCMNGFKAGYQIPVIRIWHTYLCKITHIPSRRQHKSPSQSFLS